MTYDQLAWLLFCVSLGSFGEAGVQTDLYLEWLREYCQAFFYGLAVKLLPPVTVTETGCSFRVNSNSHNLQILTGKDLVTFLTLGLPIFSLSAIVQINNVESGSNEKDYSCKVC